MENKNDKYNIQTLEEIKQEIVGDITKIINSKTNQELNNSRWNSWNYCYEAFNRKQMPAEDITDYYDNLALNLAFYLASWGMYRGSSFLLNKDYKIHINTIRLLKNEIKDKEDLIEKLVNDFMKKNKENTEIVKKDLKDKFKKSYNILFNLNNEKVDNIKDIILKYNDIKIAMEIIYNHEITDTLCTKILLGTYGCIPALDRYFKIASKFFRPESFTINENFIEWIINLKNELLKNFSSVKNQVNKYTDMKIIDMFMWKLGEKISQSIVVYYDEKTLLNNDDCVMQVNFSGESDIELKGNEDNIRRYKNKLNKNEKEKINIILYDGNEAEEVKKKIREYIDKKILN